MPMRDILLRKFSLANRTDNMDKSFALYTEILKNPYLRECFTREEIGHVFYNRSANQTEIASHYFAEANYKEAHSCMRMALSDVRNAQVWYIEQAHKDVCSERMEEYEEKRQIVVREREKAERSSWKKKMQQACDRMLDSGYLFHAEEVELNAVEGEALELTVKVP